MKNKNKPIEEMSIPSKYNLLTVEFSNLSIFNLKNHNFNYFLRINGDSDLCFEYIKNNVKITHNIFIP